MAETGNYQLKQWEKTDRIQMEDFNTDNAKTDQALAQQRDDLVALTAAMALYGNCKIWTTSYTGTGNAVTSRSLQFPWVPAAVLIIGVDGRTVLTTPGATTAVVPFTSTGIMSISWSGTTLTWQTDALGDIRMNQKDSVYQVIAWASV
ncbi:hypothetical protein JQM66_12430 [Oscillibacter valericigenes]|uniref:hypothetical protein n=1 Tax=Oscillibacter valericigenes TaxID=351091 RepID=UPI001F3BBFCB|nr:hypothetical protein [Oscillibacter valericigenes]MCF2665345.1 hypothetical protein [Oscillibacter valericigenes]